MKCVYRVWCEWDIGVDDIVFDNEEKAVVFATKALKSCGIREPYVELEDEGLVRVDAIEVK